jgi:hypothetical protein
VNKENSDVNKKGADTVCETRERDVKGNDVKQEETVM